MNEVARIANDRFKLTHSWYVDDFGMKRNAFDFFDKVNRIHYPFMGNPRVSNTDDLFNDDISPYTAEEYEEMFHEQLAVRRAP